MEPLAFNPHQPNLTLLRQAVFRRLRDQPDWDIVERYDLERQFLGRYLRIEPVTHDDADILARSLLEVLWQLTNEGVIVPGRNL